LAALELPPDELYWLWSNMPLRRAESGRSGIGNRISVRLAVYFLAGVAFSSESMFACSYSLTNATTGAPVKTITLKANSPGYGTYFFSPGSQDDSSLIAVGTSDCGTPQSPPPAANVTVTGSWVTLAYAAGPFPNGQSWDIDIGLKRQTNPFPTSITGSLTIAGGAIASATVYEIVEPPCESSYGASVCSPAIFLGSFPPALTLGTAIPNKCGSCTAVAASGTEIGSAGFIPATFAVSGGQLPPGVTLQTVHEPGGHDASGGYDYALLSGASSVAGKFPVTIQAVDSGGRKVEQSSTLLITANAISANPSALLFSFLHGDSTSISQSLMVTNGSSQSVALSAATSGQSWLGVAPADTDVAGFSSTTISVTVNPSGLAAGTYTGTVTLAGAGQQFVVPVTVTVSSAQLGIAISQTALRFQVAAGGTAPPSQSITVLNQGTGGLNWSAQASALFGNWLSVAPSAGIGGDAATVSVDPTNLAPGDYYGLVQFTAAGAANSPLSAVVVLNVFAATTAVPSIVPAGLIFVGQQGGANPAAQTVTVSNPSNQSITVTPTALAQQNGIFSTAPSTLQTVTSAESAQFMVSADLTGLMAGVYPGVIQFGFGDGSVQQVAVVLIVTPPGGGPAARPGVRGAAASGCVPTQLIPVSTGLGQSFTEPAAWPTPLIIQVVDDCGNPMGPGTVSASFSDGEPELALVSPGGGTWSGTWEPRYTAAAASVVITIQAQSSQPVLIGTLQISGTLNPNQSAPAIANGGVLNAASFAANAPLAPGGFTSIFGANFAAGPNSAGSLPLMSTLGGTQVILAGEQMPLLFAGTGQINAIIPYDIAPNAMQQLIVQQNLTLSLPQAITIAPAQPGVYTQDQSGTGIGVIVVVKPDGTQFEADSSHPASAGDALVIYCTGLGAVNPLVAAGSGAPSSPLTKTSNAVTVTIGGQPAQVLFAGLTPAFAGLYQVNAIVPSGVAAAPNVPVILTAAGLASPPVTIPIQ
jgi:uncharacterized protein (TIGR03437 family)